MSRSSSIGDTLRAFAKLHVAKEDQRAREKIAALLGCRYLTTEERIQWDRPDGPKPLPDGNQGRFRQSSSEHPPRPRQEAPEITRESTGSGGAFELERLEDASRPRPAWLEATKPFPPPPPTDRNPHYPLFRQRTVRALLSETLSSARPHGGLDLPKVIESIAKNRPLTELPRTRVRSLSAGVRVIVDHAVGMQPYAADRDWLLRKIAEVVGEHAMEVLHCTGDPWDLVREEHKEHDTPYTALPPPRPGARVAALTDLGIAPTGTGRRSTQSNWTRLMGHLCANGQALVAIVPYAPPTWPARMRRLAHLVHFDRSTSTSRARSGALRGGCTNRCLTTKPSAQTHELAVRLSLARFVDPVLLRAMRLELNRSDSGYDAGAEGELWFSSLTESRSLSGFAFHEAAAEELRAELLRRPLADIQQVWGMIRDEHGRSNPALALEETLFVLAYCPQAETTTTETQIRNALATLSKSGRRGTANWLLRLYPHLPAEIRAREDTRLLESAARLHCDRPQREGSPLAPIHGWLLPARARTTKEIGLRLQTDGRLEVGPADLEGAQRIEIEGTTPFYLWVNGERHAFRPQWPPGHVSLIPLTGNEAVVETLGGRRYRLKAQDAAIPKVFISYSRQDKEWRDRLSRHLLSLQESNVLDIWEDNQPIYVGALWQEEIIQAIESCDIAVLLLSPDYINSSYIRNVEAPRILERREEGRMRVIPVILQPCPWQEIDGLAQLQTHPTDGPPLSGLAKRDLEQSLDQLTDRIRGLTDRTSTRQMAEINDGGSPDVDISRLPQPPEILIGRQKALRTLHNAWENPNIAIVEITALGGMGKSALVGEWLNQLRDSHWNGAKKVFGWCFYDQGAGSDHQPTEEYFLHEALRWFNSNISTNVAPADRGRMLADEIVDHHTLLILDGIEPMLTPPGPAAGRLKSPGLEALLLQLTKQDHSGLCVITSRGPLSFLDEYPEKSCARIRLSGFTELEGAMYLHRLGVNRAGEEEITERDDELIDAARKMRGHPLALKLLGHYLALAYRGDVRRRELVDLWEEDSPAFGIMRVYEEWFTQGGDTGQQQLSALRLIAYFERPAAADELTLLRAHPPLEGLTEPLVGLGEKQWNRTLGYLTDCGLISIDDNDAVDAHPMIRDYLGHSLRKQRPKAWREGHRRLFERLTANAAQYPNTLASLSPLYQAVRHACLMGQYREALHEVFIERILRGTGSDGYFSTRSLGAFGADLAALASFFDRAWQHPARELKVSDRAWLLYYTSNCLRALGRISEALKPLRSATELMSGHRKWNDAANGFGNLSELELTLGNLKEARANAQFGLGMAKKNQLTAQRVRQSVALANALHQLGEADAAHELFREAEEILAEGHPAYPLLTPIHDYHYCDLLLADAEREAWLPETTPHEPSDLLSQCSMVEERVFHSMKWAEDSSNILDVALNKLILNRCALYRARLEGVATKTPMLKQTLEALRTAGRLEFLPPALLTRAWIRHTSGDETGADSDLNEAWHIAARSEMRLHMADIHLYRARLFGQPEHLAGARELIIACNYQRRLPELESTEKELERRGIIQNSLELDKSTQKKAWWKAINLWSKR